MKNVALIFGGRSTEHEVSIITALQILNGYTKEEFNILPIFIDKSNKFYLADKNQLKIEDFKHSKLDTKIFTRIYFKVGSNKIYYAKNNKPILTIDVCINACHGGEGENGNLTAMLEMCGIPSSCGNTLGMAVGFDKVASKLMLKASKISVIDCVWFYKETWENEPTKIIADLSKKKYPLIVKPARQGSSIGISVAHNPKELIEAIKVAFEFDSKVLIEKALKNFSEYNCSAIGFAGGEIEVSKVDELARLHEILSFEDKYVGGGKNSQSSKLGKSLSVKGGEKFRGSLAGSRREFLKNEKLVQKIRSMTIKAMQVLNLSGVIRVDYLFDNKRKKLYLNEINTIPGSLAFYFWTQENIDINKLIEKLVVIATLNFEHKFNVKTEYITKLI